MLMIHLLDLLITFDTNQINYQKKAHLYHDYYIKL